MSAEILNQLFELIQKRAHDAPADSYTASLLREGKEKISRKVGEEALELVIAALAQGEEEFINESADLLYHWLVLCQASAIPPEKIYQMLKQRMENA